MPSSLLKAAAVLACVLPSITASAVPAELLRPKSPWEKKGVSHAQRNPKRGFGLSVEADVAGLLDLNLSAGCEFGPSSRGCWGDFNIQDDMDQHCPDSGKTVTYNWEITNSSLSPDGYTRNVLAINGQFPGPTLYADWGDTVEVTVTNKLEYNGTGIHWHGLRQLGSTEMDGVPGLTECPIAPGQSKTYKFKLTQYGTSWYHSHYNVQYGDGVLGPIVIRGPSTANYDIDLGAYPMMDWFYTPIFTVNAASLHANGPPTADNVLLNGTMTSKYGGKYAVTTLTPGKKHLLRFVNTGINDYLNVALDGHKFQVIAADFVPIVPFVTDSLTIAIGQRYDVIIDANQTVDNYWLDVNTGSGCDGPNANAGNIRGIFRYEGAPDSDPTGSPGNGTTLRTGCNDETDLVPYVKTTVPANMPSEMNLTFTTTAQKTNLVQWLIDGTPMRINYEQPTLLSVSEGNLTFDTERHVFKIGQANQWQYWIIQQGPGTPPLPHPIHLHGHDFYILDQQAGATWTGDTSRLKTDNPTRRDTASLPAGGYLVLAFESDNPGDWLMHCHIAFHISAGFGVQFLERPNDIAGSTGPFDKGGCDSWDKYQKQEYPDGILIQGDSGL